MQTWKVAVNSCMSRVCGRRFNQLLILYRSYLSLHKSCPAVESMWTVVCMLSHLTSRTMVSFVIW